MVKQRRIASVFGLWVIVGLLAFGCAPRTGAPAPEGAPAAGVNVADEAQKEGKLVVYSTTDSASAEPLLKEFRAAYPALTVEYNDLNSTELYNRFTSEEAAGSHSADFLWSSAMDLQLKLANDGLAMTYVSPEASGLPQGSVWQNQAYGTTLEPFVFAYNKRLLP